MIAGGPIEPLAVPRPSVPRWLCSLFFLRPGPDSITSSLGLATRVLRATSVVSRIMLTAGTCRLSEVTAVTCFRVNIFSRRWDRRTTAGYALRLQTWKIRAFSQRWAKAARPPCLTLTNPFSSETAHWVAGKLGGWQGKASGPWIRRLKRLDPAHPPRSCVPRGKELCLSGSHCMWAGVRLPTDSSLMVSEPVILSLSCFSIFHIFYRTLLPFSNVPTHQEMQDFNSVLLRYSCPNCLHLLF